MDNQSWTIGRLLTWTTDFLRDKGSDSPRLDAEVLLAHARSCDRIELYTAFDETPADVVRTVFRDLVRRRAEGAPVAYLVGHREFFSLSFQVTPDVLIPRPETEQLVVRALDLAKTLTSAPAIADVGTGSGILAVCCAKHLSNASVTAIDISPAALKIAKSNAAAHSVSNRIEFLESDLFGSCPDEAKFHLVLSNPPYVSTSEMDGLAPGVRNHEPHLALDGGAEGTEVIQRLIPQAGQRLHPGGWLLIEVSPHNAQQVEQLVAENSHFVDRGILNDLANLPRIVQAQKAEQ